MVYMHAMTITQGFLCQSFNVRNQLGKNIEGEHAINVV